MGKRHWSRNTQLIAYKVIHRTGDSPDDNKDDFDIVRAKESKEIGRTRRAGVLDFVIYVASGLREALKELTFRLKQCREWFEMEPAHDGHIRFQGTKKVLELIEDLGYRAKIV